MLYEKCSFAIDVLACPHCGGRLRWTGRTLPEILSPQEVAALFRANPQPQTPRPAQTMYAGGLRVAEVTHLRVTDIDSQRMMIRIEQGKGRQDRYVMLSPTCTTSCSSTGECVAPRPCSFPNLVGRPLTRESVNRVFH